MKHCAGEVRGPAEVCRNHLHVHTVQLTFAALFGMIENMRKSIDVRKQRSMTHLF